MLEVEVFKLFALVMVRFSGLMVSAPVLGSANYPIRAKIGLAALAALLVTPMLPALGHPLPGDPLSLTLLGAGEFLIGLMIGFVVTLVFAAIQVGGQIMDMQSGFGMMNVFNPAMETQFPIFGFFLFIIAVLYLLTINGHHTMIRALVATYQHIPVGGFAPHRELMAEAALWGRAMFVDGVMIAAPLAAAMLLAYSTMGLLGRVVPQIHLFVVGFPITIATGLFLMAFVLGVYVRLLDGMLFRTFQSLETLIRGMG